MSQSLTFLVLVHELTCVHVINSYKTFILIVVTLEMTFTITYGDTIYMLICCSANIIF